MENLIKFGHKLRHAFLQTRQIASASYKDERKRIVTKVMSKLEEETEIYRKIKVTAQTDKIELDRIAQDVKD